MSIRALNLNQFFSDPTGKTHIITSRRGENRKERGYINPTNPEEANLWDSLHRGWLTVSQEPIQR